MIYAYIVLDGAEYTEIMAPFDTLPRVGEVVMFEFAAYDEEKWNLDSWESAKVLNGAEWLVQQVTHRIRRNSIDSWGTHIIELIVKRVDKP